MQKRAIILALRALLPIVVIAGSYAGYKYLVATKPEVAGKKFREKVWPVHATPVKFSDYQPTIRLYGKTVAGRQVELRALVSGKVIETGTDLKEGAFVNKGDLLVRIDPFDYRGALTEARANLAEAQAKLKEQTAQLTMDRENVARVKEQLAIAERDLSRADPLVKKGTVTAQNRDQRRLTVSQRNQAVEQAANATIMTNARIAQLEASIDRLKWKVDQAQRNLSDTVLRAPFSAYILSVRAEQGKRVGTSDSIATLIDRDWVDVTFTLSDRQYGRIIKADGDLVGRQVAVKWFVGDTPFAYTAKIERIKAEIASENGGVTVFARLADPNDPSPIRPGAFVEVQVPDRIYSRAFRVSRTALYGNDKVFVVKDSRLQQRTVKLVGTTDKDILIRGDIADGEQVITTRLSRAGQGVKVKIVPKQIDRSPAPGEPETANKQTRKHAKKDSEQGAKSSEN